MMGYIICYFLGIVTAFIFVNIMFKSLTFNAKVDMKIKDMLNKENIK
jgi:nicotinamide riboside transporter PnuC